MNLKYYVYFTMTLYSIHIFTPVQCEKVYKISDTILSCSGWLAKVIYTFCNNTYKIVKRDTSVMIEKLAPIELQRNTNLQRLVENDQWLRVRRQVASECCVQACTVGEIITYCPNDARLFLENPDIFD